LTTAVILISEAENIDLKYHRPTVSAFFLPIRYSGMSLTAEGNETLTRLKSNV